MRGLSVIKEGLLVSMVAVVLAGVTWVVVGAPDRSVPCLPENLEEGWVCLAALEEELEDIRWVDARPRAKWEENGMAESILLTDHNGENWDDLLAEAAVQLFDAPRVVVYCNETGCGSSQAVAEKLRELQLVERVDVLYGGWKALRAAGLVQR